jgi:hypothetical protein
MMAPPGVTFIHHHFVAIEKIVVPISIREVRAEDPAVAFVIAKPMPADVVVHVDARQVIIFHIVISDRAPDRLQSDIDVDSHAHLRHQRTGSAEHQHSEYNHDFSHRLSPWSFLAPSIDCFTVPAR